MSKIEWPSEEEKWMSIGYLSMNRTISSIEATVPKGKTREFQQKFVGKYDNNFPYEADKFGRQFRIYLREEALEDCPTFLYNQLDTQYKNRINDTEFIEDLVLNWGFRFSNTMPVSYNIDKIVRDKGETIYSYFRRGQKPDIVFMESMLDKYRADDSICAPIIKDLSGRKPHTSIGKKKTQETTITGEYSPRYLMRIGWLGEAYIYELLVKKYQGLYKEMGIDPTEVSDVVWFNQGYTTTNRPGLWEDQSVGHGCDLLISTTKGLFYIEVKASQRKYHLFTMTSSELKKMAEARDRYFLIKINYLERILINQSPEISVYIEPYEYFFNTNQIKEASFYLE